MRPAQLGTQDQWQCAEAFNGFDAAGQGPVVDGVRELANVFLITFSPEMVCDGASVDGRIGLPMRVPGTDLRQMTWASAVSLPIFGYKVCFIDAIERLCGRPHRSTFRNSEMNARQNVFRIRQLQPRWVANETRKIMPALHRQKGAALECHTGYRIRRWAPFSFWPWRRWRPLPSTMVLPAPVAGGFSHVGVIISDRYPDQLPCLKTGRGYRLLTRGANFGYD